MTEEHSIPDFSGDDFANDKEIQERRAAVKAYHQMIEDSWSLIQQELDAKEASHINFKGFSMFKDLSAMIAYSMKAINQEVTVRISSANYQSTYPMGKYSGTTMDQYLFGHITFPTSYPRTYIHKESIKEKFEDLFLKRDLDFPDHRKFSRTFQVLTEDQYRLKNLLQLKNLNELAAFPEMELEFSGNTALFRSSRKPISLQEAAVFCNLTKVLLRVFR